MVLGTARRTASLRLAVGLVLLAVSAGGCGHLQAAPQAPSSSGSPAASSPSPTPTPTPTTTRTSPGSRLLVGSGVVLDAGDGPELCLGAILTSYPPGCSGPPVDGWRWPRRGTERVGSVTWGDFFVVGTWNGERFTFDRLVTRRQASASFPPPEPETALGTPCPEPAGGWRAPDPRRSTSDDQQKVLALAAKLPDYVELWVDDRGDPRQDPLTTVIDVQVTKDTARAEQRIRTVWGGPLCVSIGPHTQREVRKVRKQLSDEPGIVSSWTRQGVLTIELVYDDGTRQRRYDERFGRGLVTVESALHPYLG